LLCNPDFLPETFERTFKYHEYRLPDGRLHPVVASVPILRRRQAHICHAALGDGRSARLAAGLFRWITLFGLIGF
jgi:hypothetical protein